MLVCADCTRRCQAVHMVYMEWKVQEFPYCVCFDSISTVSAEHPLSKTHACVSAACVSPPPPLEPNTERLIYSWIIGSEQQICPAQSCSTCGDSGCLGRSRRVSKLSRRVSTLSRRVSTLSMRVYTLAFQANSRRCAGRLCSAAA
eukprot:350126-Chlamydomonas_euryale.AAC.1